MEERQRYAVDSRKVQPDDIFFALSGEKVDGHHFLPAVKKAGARGAFVKKGHSYDAADLVVCQVEDPLQELQQLAFQKLERLKPLIIAVTGSYAKTTTKETLHTYLSQFESCFKSCGNANSQIGLPLSILNEYKDEPIAIVEMGIEHPHDMEKLKKIIKPDFAVITRIAHAHVETMGSIEKVFLEKIKIIEAKKTKVLFAHYSVEPFLKLVDLNEVEVEIYGKADEELFADISDLAKRISKRLNYAEKRVELTLQPLRFEKVAYPKGDAFFDCYNANPASMREFFFKFAAKYASGRKVAVFGQIAALGNLSDSIHLELILEISDLFDPIFLFGNSCFTGYKQLKAAGKNVFFSNSLEILESQLKDHLKNGDCIFIKGSNVNRLWEIRGCLEQIFSL
jgi:UDP-N-acetylmuramoyl-tripeptide--D-alanyl-D-alanine ligase